MNDQVSLQTIITIIGFAITICSFCISRRKDIESKVESNTKLNYKLDQQCTDIIQIKDGIRDTNQTLATIVKTQTMHDKDIQHLTDAVRRLEERIDNLEKQMRED